MQLKTIRRLFFFSLMSTSLYACDSSQSLTDDTKPEGTRMVELRVNEDIKGAVDAYDLDGDYYNTVTIGGTETSVISIASIIQSVLEIKDADLKSELEKYTCNYESATDGFRPTDKGDKCAPVSCSKAFYSYIDTKTGNLVYGDELGTDRPGCYNVKNIGKILLTEVKANAKLFELYIDNAKYGSIDLSTMGDLIVEKDGKKVVKLANVFRQMQPNKTYDKYECDLADESGKKMSSDASCPVRSCNDVMEGYIEISSQNIVDETAAKKAACYEMKSAKALYMTTPETDTALNITVKLDDKEIATVDAKTLGDKIFEENGSKYVWASDVIAAVKPDLNLDDYKCNYLGQNEKDGNISVYDPTSKSACKEIRSCKYAKSAKIDLTVKKMSMTDAEKQNCHNVSNITTILVYSQAGGSDNDQKPTPKSYIVNVQVDGTETVKEVNVYDLEAKFVEKEGKQTIAASEIIAAAQLDGYAADKYTCDYVAADGFKASAKSDCNPPRVCSEAESIVLVVEDKKLSTDLPAECLKIKDFKTIIVKKIDG